MRVSELQELLSKARYNHGDIEVEISRPYPFYGRVYDRIDQVVVQRGMKHEEIPVTEKLSKLGGPKLILKYVPTESDEK